MTITEAMRESRKTGQAYCRGGGWIRWHDPWTYELSGEDLVADDWEPLGQPPPVWPEQSKTSG